MVRFKLSFLVIGKKNNNNNKTTRAVSVQLMWSALRIP